MIRTADVAGMVGLAGFGTAAIVPADTAERERAGQARADDRRADD